MATKHSSHAPQRSLPFRRASLLLAVGFLLALVVLGRDLIERALYPCTPGVDWQGRTLSVEAATAALSVKTVSESAAAKEVSQLILLYTERNRQLCEDNRRGKLPDKEYVAERQRVSELFAKLVHLQQVRPANAVMPEEVEWFREELRPFLTADKAVPVAIQYRVVRDGKPLPNPARLESGARFVIEIKQSTEAYVYAVLIDSRNRAHRLYPASLTGTDNPVRGDLRIPKEPGAFLVLDEITGTERILIFAQQDPSPVIERELKAITDRPGGDYALQATTRLDRVHQVRGIYVEKGSAPEAGSGGPGFAEVTSPLGRPVVMFTIEHTSVSASLTTDGRTTRRP